MHVGVHGFCKASYAWAVSGIGTVDDERQWSNRRDAEVIVFVCVGGGAS